jgi:hypothetical protein
MTCHRVILGFVVIGALLGCSDGGPRLGRVSGTVTAEGKPLSNASVVFGPQSTDVNSGASSAITDSEGRYTLKFGSKRLGAAVGPHHVMIQHTEYANFDLKATVQEGNNTIDFQLGPQDKVGRGGRGGRPREDDAIPLEVSK